MTNLSKHGEWFTAIQQTKQGEAHERFDAMQQRGQKIYGAELDWAKSIAAFEQAYISERGSRHDSENVTGFRRELLNDPKGDKDRRMQEIAAAGRVLLTRPAASVLGYGIEALAMISAFPPDKQDWALEGKRTIKELREVRKQLSPKKEEVVDHISHPDDMWWEYLIGSTIELIDLLLELPS